MEIKIAIVLGLAVALLVGLVEAERAQRAKRILEFKTPLSLLFIVAWITPVLRRPVSAGLFRRLDPGVT